MCLKLVAVRVAWRGGGQRSGVKREPGGVGGLLSSGYAEQCSYREKSGEESV